MVFGSTFGTFNAANAGDINVVEGKTVIAANATGADAGSQAITVNDSLVIAGGDATINTASTLIDVAEIQSDTGNTIVTLAGTGGLLADKLNAEKDLFITVNNGNFLSTGVTSTETSGEVLTIDLVDTSEFRIVAAITNVGDLTADADGDGTFVISAALTNTGLVGSASLDIGTVNVNAATTFNGATHARDVNVAANTDFTIDLFANTVDITGTSTTLTLGAELALASGSTSVVTMNATGQKNYFRWNS
jgi:hypothetical protein